MIKINDYLDENEMKEYKSWDYNLDYKSTYKTLLDEIKSSREILNSGNITTNRLKRFSYLILGLTQLRNGARIGEIIESFKLFIQDKSKRVVQTRVQKRKDDYFRKIVLPDEITKLDLELIERTLGIHDDRKRNFVSCLSHFFKNNFNYSTHALRYAFISFMAVAQTPVNVIAKITGHKTLDLILHYTQRKLADRVLFNVHDDYSFS